MIERPDSSERAVLVHVYFPAESDCEDLQEFTELVKSAGATPVVTVTGSRSAPNSRLFVGRGKVEEILAAVKQYNADIVIFNHALSPSQERNLERELSCRVLARTGLILDIFAQRARSFEGKLQVELAQLRHLSTRLIRGWTHLERQKGGIGLRGPGETQLETDRRLLNARIKKINRRLEKVHKQRAQGRRSRQRADIPTVSLVGYTNAGKSTLFNALTGADTYVADQLFATLDPTLRRIELEGIGPVVLIDTVGFIRHLPHDLVAAFRATLEETHQADLLLLVVDASDEERAAHIEQVNEVLSDMGADRIPQLRVYNKIDLTGAAPHQEENEAGLPEKIWCSAVTGDGLDLIVQALTKYFAGHQVHGWLYIPVGDGQVRSRLYELGKVLSEQVDEHGDWRVEVRMDQREINKLTGKKSSRCVFHPVETMNSLAGTAQAS